MKTLSNVFLVIHLLAIAGIVILLLTQGGKTIKVIPKGLFHAEITALIAGLVMVGIRSGQHHQRPAVYANYNYATLAAKLAVLIVIIYITVKNAKAASISRGTWVALLGFTVINIGLAGSLK
jgi:hypothetical protein